MQYKTVNDLIRDVAKRVEELTDMGLTDLRRMSTGYGDNIPVGACQEYKQYTRGKAIAEIIANEFLDSQVQNDA